LYIDESGDHTYRQLADLSKKYLGLTGVLIKKTDYDPHIPEALERLKRTFFTYDPDIPPILVRQDVISRKKWFGILRDPQINAKWETAVLAFYAGLPAQIFTVVIDKKTHFQRFATGAWNPYSYSMAVLLNRVRGYLKLHGATADVMPESRGQTEDSELLTAYVELRTNSSIYGKAGDYQAAFPRDRLLFRRKDHNVAGLQLADLVAADQKLLTVQEAKRTMPHPIGPFGQRLNRAVAGKVNRYGRYLLE
jgi:hypothetical protein